MTNKPTIEHATGQQMVDEIAAYLDAVSQEEGRTWKGEHPLTLIIAMNSLQRQQIEELQRQVMSLLDLGTRTSALLVDLTDSITKINENQEAQNASQHASEIHRDALRRRLRDACREPRAVPCRDHRTRDHR